MWGGADKSLARPGNKQAMATKLRIYSTYSPRSSVHFLARCSNFCKPLKKKLRRLSVQPGFHGSIDLCVGWKMATFQLFFQSREQVVVWQEKTCNSASEQTPLSNDTIDSILRSREVGRAKDLSAPPRNTGHFTVTCWSSLTQQLCGISIFLYVSVSVVFPLTISKICYFWEGIIPSAVSFWLIPTFFFCDKNWVCTRHVMKCGIWDLWKNWCFLVL